MNAVVRKVSEQSALALQVGVTGKLAEQPVESGMGQGHLLAAQAFQLAALPATPADQDFLGVVEIHQWGKTP
jgi:hypothetical protein